MGDIVNLNRYRKQKERAERERRANEKRARFGIPKTERAKTSAERAQRLLEELVPDELKTPMHVGMIRLGRELCKAGRPRCEDCPLFELCPTGPVVLGVGRRS